MRSFLAGCRLETYGHTYMHAHICIYMLAHTRTHVDYASLSDRTWFHKQLAFIYSLKAERKKRKKEIKIKKEKEKERKKQKWLLMG